MKGSFRVVPAYDGHRPALHVWLKENRRHWEVWMQTGAIKCRIGSIIGINLVLLWRPWAGSVVDKKLTKALIAAASEMNNRR